MPSVNIQMLLPDSRAPTKSHLYLLHGERVCVGESRGGRGGSCKLDSVHWHFLGDVDEDVVRDDVPPGVALNPNAETLCGVQTLHVQWVTKPT